MHCSYLPIKPKALHLFCIDHSFSLSFLINPSMQTNALSHTHSDTHSLVSLYCMCPFSILIIYLFKYHYLSMLSVGIFWVSHYHLFFFSDTCIYIRPDIQSIHSNSVSQVLKIVVRHYLQHHSILHSILDTHTSSIYQVIDDVVSKIWIGYHKLSSIFTFKVTKAPCVLCAKSFKGFSWWGQVIFNAGNSNIKQSYGVSLTSFVWASLEELFCEPLFGDFPVIFWKERE